MNTVSQKSKPKDDVLNSQSEPQLNNEFQNAVCDLFEKSGVMENLRAYLRSNLVKILNHSQPGIPILQPAKFTERLERPMQAINILIAEYFIRQEFNFTLSVFVAEIPLANMLFILSKSLMDSATKLQNLESLQFQQSDVWSVLNCLGLQFDSVQAKNIWNLYEKSDKKLPLLLCIFKSLNKPADAMLPLFLAHKSNKHRLFTKYKKGRVYRNKDKKLISKLVATMMSTKPLEHVLARKQEDLEQLKLKENMLVEELAAQTARLGGVERRYRAKRQFLWAAARALRDQHATMQRALAGLARDNQRLLRTIEQLKAQLNEALKAKIARAPPSRTHSSHQLRTARSPPAGRCPPASSSPPASLSSPASPSQLAASRPQPASLRAGATQALNLINNDLKKNNNTQKKDSDAQACGLTAREMQLRAEACRLREDNAKLRELVVKQGELMLSLRRSGPASRTIETQYDPCKDGMPERAVRIRGVQTELRTTPQLYNNAYRTEERFKEVTNRRDSGKSVRAQTVDVGKERERAEDEIGRSTAGLVEEARRKLLKLSIESEAVEKSYQDFKSRLANKKSCRRTNTSCIPKFQEECSHDKSEYICHGSYLERSTSCRNANDMNQRRDIEYTQTKNSRRERQETNNYQNDYFARKIMLNHQLSEARKNKDAICTKLVPTAVTLTETKMENLIEKPLNEFRNLYYKNCKNNLMSADYVNKELVGDTLNSSLIPENTNTEVVHHTVDKRSNILTGDERILVEVTDFEIDASNYTVKFPCRKFSATQNCAISVESNMDLSKITSTTSINTKTKKSTRQKPHLAMEVPIAETNERDDFHVRYVAQHEESASNQTLIHSNLYYNSDASGLNSINKKDEPNRKVNTTGSSSCPESVELNITSPTSQINEHVISSHGLTAHVTEVNSFDLKTSGDYCEKIKESNENKDKLNTLSFEDMCSVFKQIETNNDTGLLESISKKEEITKIEHIQNTLRIFNDLETGKGKDELTNNNLRKTSDNDKHLKVDSGSYDKDKKISKQHINNESNSNTTVNEDPNSYKTELISKENPAAKIPSDSHEDNIPSKDQDAESDTYDEDFEDSKDHSSDSTISYASQSKEDTFWNG